jgi:hypothetical protein
LLGFLRYMNNEKYWNWLCLMIGFFDFYGCLCLVVGF